MLGSPLAPCTRCAVPARRCFVALLRRHHSRCTQHVLFTACRFQSTTASPSPTTPSNPAGSGFTQRSRTTPAATALPPPPPPLSVLSWAVDGSGHTHHHCARRLSMAQRIPLLCETIRRAAADVVALQDSTPELAEALVGEKNSDAERGDDAGRMEVKVFCEELARELREPRPHQPAESQEDAPSTQEETPPALPLSSPAGTPACSYRLVGRARNGRCGEVQLFVLSSSPWSARLLPGLGAGLTVELCSSTTLTASAVGESNSTASAAATESETTLAADTQTHRCVLTTLDLSYRGKSLGTHVTGLLSNAAVSAEGSPFTLQTQQPSSSAAQQRGGRPLGQLDAHRAAAFDWVHHHIRPDLVVGNVFMGAKERVPGFTDAWVWAGSPSGQERTTNTCARHRIDRQTNYFYFRPSPGLAKTKSSVHRRPQLEGREEEQQREVVDSAEGRLPEGAAGVTSLPPDATVGTPLPLTAFVGAADGAWQVPSPSSASGAATRWASQAGSASVFEEATTGMPEVAGRFQRSLFRARERRGPPSRGGHRSDHPFLSRYHRCRVVVLRPMTTVELSAEEQAWHARHITAHYGHSARKPAASAAHATAEADEAGEAGEGKQEEEEVAEAPRVAGVPSRVRCSLSNQYPLLTILNQGRR